MTDVCSVCSALLDPDTPALAVQRSAGALSLSMPVCADHADSAARHLDSLLDDVRRALVRETSGRLRAGEDVAAIRSWALSNGLPVAAAGRLSGSLVAAYRAAHGAVASA